MKSADEILKNTIKKNTPSHAYLFFGLNDEELSKKAVEFAKGLLCTKADLYCDKCLSCKKANDMTHPDIIHIYKDGNSIKIKQIREIRDESIFSPVEGEYKIFIIHNAITMQEPAQNAFLKTLEEPTKNIIFILLSENKNVFLPTVLSRCMSISFEDKEKIILKQEEAQWLLIKLEQILTDKKVDLVQISKALCEDKEKTKKYASFILNFFCDVLIYKNTNIEIKEKCNAYSEYIKTISKIINTQKLNYIINEVSEILADMTFNLNIHMAMLSLLIIIQEDLYAENSRNPL